MIWPARSRTAPIYLFLHIPKCAGTTLVKSLARLGSRRHITVPYSPQSKREVIDQIHDRLQQRRSTADQLVAVSGHGVFRGLHEISSRPACYFTVLRQPHSRYVSHYQFLVDCAHNEKHSLHFSAKRQVMRSHGPLSLEEFAEQGSARNTMTRHLAATSDEGDFSMRQSNEYDSEELLELATEALRTIDLIGLVEEFPEDLHRICRMVGVRPARIANRSLTRVDPAQITPRIHQLIADNNRLDTRLYERAAQLRRGYIMPAAAA